VCFVVLAQNVVERRADDLLGFDHENAGAVGEM
jgi:hypothetical protein